MGKEARVLSEAILSEISAFIEENKDGFL
jgi:hypothetical protein